MDPSPSVKLRNGKCFLVCNTGCEFYDSHNLIFVTLEYINIWTIFLKINLISQTHKQLIPNVVERMGGTRRSEKKLCYRHWYHTHTLLLIVRLSAWLRRLVLIGKSTIVGVVVALTLLLNMYTYIVVKVWISPFSPPRFLLHFSAPVVLSLPD